MDRAAYGKMRAQLKFEKKTGVLVFQMILNLAIVLDVFFIWADFGDTALIYLTIPMLTVLMFRSFGLMHESSHGLSVKSRRWNDWLGVVNGCFCFLPFEGWKKSHLQHHKWSGNVEKDPVMAFIIAHPKIAPGGQRLLSHLWKLWIPVLAFVQNVVFWQLSIKTYGAEPRSFRYFMSLLLPVVSWTALVAFSPIEFLVLALAPSVILYLVAVEVVNLPHHLQLPQFRGDQQFPAWQQYQTARSCGYPRWFARFFAMNFNYHTEHHMFPDAPWYELERVGAIVRNELSSKYNHDQSLRWILENKRRTVGEVLSPENLDESQTHGIGTDRNRLAG